jgi:hypothetical protein
MRLCHRSFLVALLGSLFLSLADSAAGADTAAAEQVIRIQMKMGIVGTRVQAWLAAGGTPQQVEALSQGVGTYLTSGELAKAETSMDSLFDIIVGRRRRRRRRRSPRSRHGSLACTPRSSAGWPRGVIWTRSLRCGRHWAAA